MLIKKGSVNVSVNIRIVDSTDGTPETAVEHNTAGIDMWYRREGAAVSSITEVALAALTTAHTDGGIEHISHGWYRLDVPDAAFATGVDGVQIGGTVTGMIVHAPYVQLIDIDLMDSVRAGLTALPNAAADAAGGLPISDAGGLDLDAMNTNINDIETDTNELQTDWVNGGRLDLLIDAILEDTGTTLDTKIDDIQGVGFVTGTDSLEAIRDRGDAAWTGSATTSDSGTAQAGSATTITLAATAPATDNILEGHLIFISSGTGAGQAKAIDENGYNGTTKVATIIGTWEVNPDATSVYEVTPDAITEITVPPTVAAIADGVWDENTTGHTTAGTFGEQAKNDIDAILADTGDMQPKFGTPAADLAADIAAVKVDTAATLVDTAEIGAAGVGLTDLGGMSTGMKAEVNAEVDGALDTAIPGVPTADSINQRVRSMDLLTEAAGAGDLAAILVDTGTSIPADIAALNDLSAANVNAEVVDVINTDTSNEPGQAAPPVDTSLRTKIDYLYKAWRNKATQTATEYKLFNDDGTTVAQKATVSDDATTATKGEVGTGP